MGRYRCDSAAANYQRAAGSSDLPLAARFWCVPNCSQLPVGERRLSQVVTHVTSYASIAIRSRHATIENLVASVAFHPLWISALQLYGLNRACPYSPAAVFTVTVMAAPASGFFVSPFSVAPSEGTSATVSRSEPRDRSAEAAKPLVATGLLPSSNTLMVIVLPEIMSSAWTPATSSI